MGKPWLAAPRKWTLDKQVLAFATNEFIGPLRQQWAVDRYDAWPETFWDPCSPVLP